MECDAAKLTLRDKASHLLTCIYIPVEHKDTIKSTCNVQKKLMLILYYGMHLMCMAQHEPIQQHACDSQDATKQGANKP